MSIVVLDPGHGGRGGGGTTGAGVIGPRGVAEKDVALAIARRAAARLRATGREIVLTRDDDLAVPLAARAERARALRAAALVSLHFDHDPDPSVQGTSAWAHDGADGASLRLARALAAAVGAVTGHAVAPVGRAPLAVLDPRRLDPGTAAAHVELAYLSDPREEARLGDPAYLDGLADAIVAAVDRTVPAAATLHDRRRRIDLWHEVPLVPQVTGMSCWAAGAAMLIGWRDSIPVDPEEVARAAGRWQEYRDGLEPQDVESFAGRWGLRARRPGMLGARQVEELLVAHGPLWVGEASPGLHVVVIAGMIGDGTDDGTELRIVDPWPVGRGERYRLSVRALSASHATASRIAGAEALVLHTDGRGRGRGARQIRAEERATSAASCRSSAR
jgi:N-acetylmuramoyl-L-alanine amidase